MKGKTNKPESKETEKTNIKTRLSKQRKIKKKKRQESRKQIATPVTALKKVSVINAKQILSMSHIIADTRMYTLIHERIKS